MRMAKKNRKKSFGLWATKLKNARKAEKLTQVEAAKKLGVATSTLISWENDHRIPGKPAQMLIDLVFPVKK
jgi:DNA-binding transcriptional regulator YiaG